MDNNRFSIFEAVRDAYAFAGREWLYLAKVGLLPVMLQICLALFVQFQRPEASQIEGYLWSLPATALFSWFMFLETRLLLLGERLDHLPTDRHYLTLRLRAMKLSVIISLLFNMGVTAALATVAALLSSGYWGTNWLLTLAGLFILGGLFWSIRFGVMPIVAAVHFPLRPVIQQTWGMMFSFRLLGMAMICIFPVAILFQIFLSLFIQLPDDPAAELKLTVMEQAGVIAVSAPLSLIVTTLVNAAAAYALKQLLGGHRSEVRA